MLKTNTEPALPSTTRQQYTNDLLRAMAQISANQKKLETPEIDHVLKENIENQIKCTIKDIGTRALKDSLSVWYAVRSAAREKELLHPEFVETMKLFEDLCCFRLWYSKGQAIPHYVPNFFIDVKKLVAKNKAEIPHIRAFFTEIETELRKRKYKFQSARFCGEKICRQGGLDVDSIVAKCNEFLEELG